MKIMKKIYSIILATLIISAELFSQNTWTAKANIGGFSRESAVGFSVNGKGYVCCGRSGTSTYLTDLWEYDPTLDTWTQKLSYPGTGSFNPTAFVIGNLAYVGLGASPTTQTDWWEYNPATNTWASKAPFPGVARYGAGGFSIGTKGYVVGGTAGGPPYLSDMWAYDQATNTWSACTAFTGGSRNHPACFSYNGKGYVGTGSSGTSTGTNDMWEYDPTLNAWTAKMSFVGTARRSTMYFGLNNLLFVCAGLDGSGIVMQDLWEYNAQTNVWTNRLSFPGTSRWEGIGFSLNGYGYAGGGADASLATSYNDFWQYAPINVGIEESVLDIVVNLYPNPVIDGCTISLSKEINDGVLTVYDVKGALVKAVSFEGKEIKFQKGNFESGNYFYSIASKRTKIASGKFSIK